MPEITKTERGSFWKNTYKTFEALVYVPVTKLNDNELNYGFIAPYILVFNEKNLTIHLKDCSCFYFR